MPQRAHPASKRVGHGLLDRDFQRNRMWLVSRNVFLRRIRLCWRRLLVVDTRGQRVEDRAVVDVRASLLSITAPNINSVVWVVPFRVSCFVLRDFLRRAQGFCGFLRHVAKFCDISQSFATCRTSQKTCRKNLRFFATCLFGVAKFTTIHFLNYDMSMPD